jgi:hypothetical protein
MGQISADWGGRLLEIPVRHQHCMRHTFISLAQDDGGDGSVLRWITHAPPRSAFDWYTRWQWSRMCVELAKLQMNPPPPPLAVKLNGREAVREQLLTGDR